MADRIGTRVKVGTAVRAVAIAAAAFALTGAAAGPRGEWAVYGGDSAGTRFSPLTQINAENVSRLQQVWKVDVGEGGLQTTPLMADGRLFVVSPTQKVLALDPVSGRTLWTYDPGFVGQQPVRGLSLWRQGRESRLFVGLGTGLYALDPASGRPIPGFGRSGVVDLREGLDRDPQTIGVFMTTPGVIYRDLIITGFRTAEANPAAPGAVRAYDVRTGRLRWIFRLIPRRGDPGAETWPARAWETQGGANPWAGMVVDERRGIVYAPTGSATPDFYGADRRGANLYANSLVALDAATGRKLWHFQAVRHDILDRDFPSPPVLLTVNHQGRRVDAVAQPTKQGYLFVLDRVTGRSLFPIEEMPAPRSTVDGEESWPTQPRPVKPAPYARQAFTEALLTQRTPKAAADARAAFANLHADGPFAPMRLDKQTIIFPGFDGGAEWGGPAVDPRRGVIYINSNDVPWLGRLIPAFADASKGATIYMQQCASCHGADRQGSPPQTPGLVGVTSRMMDQHIAMIIMRGSGRMPGFPQLKLPDLHALVAYLRTRPGDPPPSAPASERREVQPEGQPLGTRYVFDGYRKFTDSEGYPAVAPPWGTLNAIDLNTGEYLWKIPFGEYPELVAKGMRDTGSENYGGPVVTASGLLFIAATIRDNKIRAFEAATGRLLWEGRLPNAGNATPITYMAGGRQYVVVAASSRNPFGPQAASYVAFALP